MWALKFLITYFDNFVGEAAELSQCFFDFETIESDEKRYSSIKPKSGYRVVCDLSGLGVGRPMQIPHESYVKWARRISFIRDEIESLVAPLDGNDPLLENEIYEWIGDVNVASDWDFLKKENRSELLSVVATIINTDYIRYVKETDEIKGSNYHLMSREFFDSLGDGKGGLNSNDLGPKEVLLENERGSFSIFVDGSSEE